jgi:hypothetical protein
MPTRQLTLFALLVLGAASLHAQASGAFQGAMTGAATGTIQGAAIFVPRTELLPGVPVAAIELHLDGPVQGVISLNRPFPGVPAVGSYPVANAWRTAEGGQRLHVGEQVMLSHVMLNARRPMLFLSESGMVTITRVSDTHIEGTFTIAVAGVDMIRREERGLALNVTGTFKAQLP